MNANNLFNKLYYNIKCHGVNFTSDKLEKDGFTKEKMSKMLMFTKDNFIIFFDYSELCELQRLKVKVFESTGVKFKMRQCIMNIEK